MEAARVDDPTLLLTHQIIMDQGEETTARALAEGINHTFRPQHLGLRTIWSLVVMSRLMIQVITIGGTLGLLQGGRVLACLVDQGAQDID